MVMTQAMTTLCATPQRIAEARLAVPAPMTQPVIVCVVDTGMPSSEAVKTMIEPPVEALEALVLRQLGDAAAIVSMIFQPPDIVPSADRDVARDRHPVRHVEFAAEIAGRIEHGDDAHRLLRIVEPVAERIGGRRQCRQRSNMPSAAREVELRKAHEVISMISIDSSMPSTGDSTMATSVLLSPLH